MRHWITTLFLLTAAVQSLAAAPQGEDADRGWTFYGRFQSSSNESGMVLKMDPAVGYTFSKYLQMSAGIPVYFVRESSTELTAPTNPGFVNGVGNAYVNGQFTLLNPTVDYISNLTITAPTGDENRGFSTGNVTVDWNNAFSRSFGRVTPFVNIGIANTISDTSFFVRPFSSDGLASHFEGGTSLELHPIVSVGASGYAVRASGEQRIISRVRRQVTGETGATGAAARQRPIFEDVYETIAGAEAANDQGFSGWLSFFPASKVYLQGGYSRSTRYDLNSVFFGVGFRIGK